MNGDVVDKGETVGCLRKESERYRMEHALCQDLLNETLSLGHSISSDDLLSVGSKSCNSDHEKDYLNTALSDGQSISSDDLLSEGSDIEDDFSFPIIVIGTADEKASDVKSQESLEDGISDRNVPFEELETIMEEGESDEEKEEFKRQKEKYFKLKEALESPCTKQEQNSTHTTDGIICNGIQARTKNYSGFSSYEIDNTCPYDAGDEQEYDSHVSFRMHQNGEISNQNVRQDLTTETTENEHKIVEGGTVFTPKPDRECVIKLDENIDRTFRNSPELIQEGERMDEDNCAHIIVAATKSSSVGVLHPFEEQESDHNMENGKQVEHGNLPEEDYLEQSTSPIEPTQKENDNESHIGHARHSLLHEGSPYCQINGNVRNMSFTKRSLSSLERQVEHDDDLYAGSISQKRDAKWGFLNTLWFGLYRITSRGRDTSSDGSLEEGLLTNPERDESPTRLNDPEYLRKFIIFTLILLFVMMFAYLIL